MHAMYQSPRGKIARKPPLFLSMGLALLVNGTNASAQVQELAPVLVEDARRDPDAPPAHSRLALPKSVQASETLSREDIAAIRPRDVPDLIESALGMSISRQGARVHNFSYNRGDSVGIILDGVYLSPTEAQRILGDLPTEMIESVQFLRDSTVITIAPLMSFGSANSGSPNQGFIVITTRKSGPGKDGGEVRASYASYETWKSSAFFGHSWLDGKLTLGAGYQHSESAGKADWNNAYNGDTLLLNGGYNGPELIATASLFLNQASREIQRATGTYTGVTNYPVSGPTPNGVLDKNIWKYDPMDTAAFSLNLARPWNDRHTTALTYGWTEAKGTQYAYTTTSSKASVAGKEAKDSVDEWNLSHTVTSQQNTFKIGIQNLNWLQLSEGNSLARKEEIRGYYVTDEYRILPDWSVDTAYRMDEKKILQGGDKYLADGSKVLLSNGQSTDKATLFSVGSAWQINDIYRVSARYSFNQTPTPDVLTTRNNATLADEERTRYELGLEAHFSKAVQATLTPFYYDIKNAKVSDGSITKDALGNPLIDAATGLPTSVTVYKAADRRRQGFELNLKGRFAADAFGYELGWTHFTDSQEDGITGSEFPDNKLSARLNWRHGAWNSNLSLLHVDPYLSYGYTVGDFTTVNLSIARQFDHGITVTLYGQNLTDEHYGTNNKGYPATANWGVLRDVGATYGIEMGVKF